MAVNIFCGLLFNVTYLLCSLCVPMDFGFSAPAFTPFPPRVHRICLLRPLVVSVRRDSEVPYFFFYTQSLHASPALSISYVPHADMEPVKANAPSPVPIVLALLLRLLTAFHTTRPCSTAFSVLTLAYTFLPVVRFPFPIAAPL